MLEKRNGHISKETGIWESQEGIFASEEYRYVIHRPDNECV